jgi:hypothetical protein
MNVATSPQTAKRPHPRRWALRTLLLACAAAAAAPAFAQTAAPAAEEKAVRVVDTKSDRLALKVASTKDSFGIDEPIRFKVSGNRTFYLYVYSVDQDTGDATLLIPSRRHTNNKYRGGREFRVPDKDLEFVADKAKRERFVFVASARQIDLARAQRTDPGDLQAAAAKEGGDWLVAKESALEGMFAEKGVRVREPNTDQPNPDVAVRELEVKITGTAPRGDRTGTTDTAGAVAFVNTDRTRYREGERIRIAYGADRSGWVTLFSVEPDGTVSRLRSEKVTGDKVYNLSARAEDPIGAHTLAAVFSEDGQVDESALDGLPGVRASGFGAKAIVPDGEPQAMIAVREIRVER